MKRRKSYLNNRIARQSEAFRNALIIAEYTDWIGTQTLSR